MELNCFTSHCWSWGPDVAARNVFYPCTWRHGHWPHKLFASENQNKVTIYFIYFHIIYITNRLIYYQNMIHWVKAITVNFRFVLKLAHVDQIWATFCGRGSVSVRVNMWHGLAVWPWCTSAIRSRVGLMVSFRLLLERQVLSVQSIVVAMCWVGAKCGQRVIWVVEGDRWQARFQFQGKSSSHCSMLSTKCQLSSILQEMQKKHKFDYSAAVGASCSYPAGKLLLTNL